MKYKNYQRNHVILPGREEALEAFLKQNYKGIGHHKWKHRLNSNSEDALTWSCFEILSSFPLPIKIMALDEIFEDAYEGQSNFLFKDGKFQEDQIQIHVGKQYTGSATKESTEVDASIELPGKLIFFEAKLYSVISMASPEKPYDQIARKLRIGLDSPLQDAREFYFIFLDIAPLDKLTRRKIKEEDLAKVKGGFEDKWTSAWQFNYYKLGQNNSLSPLKKVLEGIHTSSVESVAANMGWLTWSDLFKTILRGMISNKTTR